MTWSAKEAVAVLRYLLAWFPMLILAIANGAFRELTFTKAMPEPLAHQLSTLIGALAIGDFICLVIRKCPPESDRQAWSSALSGWR